MKIIRELRLPGRRDFESSGFTVELEPKDIGLANPTTVEEMRFVTHKLFTEAQLTILTHAAADGLIGTAEVEERMAMLRKEGSVWGMKRSNNQPSPIPGSSPTSTSSGSGNSG